MIKVAQWLQILITAIVSILASSGFWAFLSTKTSKSDARTKLLVGLGHDRIVWIGMQYLNRGDWITRDEYENLVDYLWEPYSACGGNGSAKRVIDAVRTLKIVDKPPIPRQNKPKTNVEHN